MHCFERTRDTDQRIHEPCACSWVPCSSRSYGISVAFARWNLFIACATKTMKRRPCWCPKPILWEMNSFLMQTLSFDPINLHRCWPREWKHSISLYVEYSQTLFFEDCKFAYKTTKFLRKMTCAQLRTKTSKDLPRKVGISNSLCSRTV